MRTYANFKKYVRMLLTVIAKTSRCYHRRSIRYDTGRTQYQCKRHYPVLLLFDSFQAPPKENSLELVVKFVNLNYNTDSEILQRSPSLLGYSKLLYYIKTAAKENGGDLKSAIDTSVKQCMEEGLIEDFLRKHSREVTGMLFNEITVEEFAEIRAREAYEDGEKSGFTKGEKSGFTKGETAGLAKGAAQEKREIARNLMQLGLDLAQIRQATGLTAEEIEKL